MRPGNGASLGAEVFPILSSSQTWRLWQLADSAFPSGGFAHSAGLEAALQQGEVEGAIGFERFLREALWQAGRSGIPLANAAYSRTRDLFELDQFCDAFLSNAVANRASRVQGRTFLDTCERAFDLAELCDLGLHLRERKACVHHAPVFGEVLRILGLGKGDMQRLFLHLTLRGAVSAAIRLGIVGPYQAQRVQDQFRELLDEVHRACQDLDWRDLAQTAPLLDLFQGNHDRLYSRLFQS